MNQKTKNLNRRLAAALIEHGRIRTTLTRAKNLRPVVEKLITRAKLSDSLPDQGLVKTKVLKEVGQKFAGRAGGYTRILKLGPRKTDSAEEAIIELVD